MRFLGGREVLKLKLANTLMTGFFPIHKPKNICCNKLLNVIKADIGFVLKSYELRHAPIAINYARYLEPFASGIVTFALGNANHNKRNFVYAEQKYRALIELGAERKFECIDGELVSSSSFNHIDRELFESQLPYFIGEIEQDRLGIPEQSLNKSDSISLTVEDYYNRIEVLNIWSEKIPIVQKFPLERPRRKSLTKSIKLIEFQKPLALVEITCQGNFSARQFVKDLATKLKTKASILELTRLEEGPASVEDMRLFQLHEVNFEYYVHWLPFFTKIYGNYLSKLEHHFENDSTYRPI